MLPNEIGDQCPHRVTLRIDGGDRGLPRGLARTLVRLLVAHEVRRDEECVLEIVDAERRSFSKGHRAQMSGDLQSALVRLLDRRGELGARDVHVRLERRCAFIGPEVHHAPRVVRPGELVNLVQPETRTLEIRTGRIDPWPGLSARVDVALDPDVGEAVHVSAGPHRRDSAGQIKPREALGDVAVDARSGRVEQMLVHHH